jgi:hypothetical protein
VIILEPPFLYSHVKIREKPREERERDNEKEKEERGPPSGKIVIIVFFKSILSRPVSLLLSIL